MSIRLLLFGPPRLAQADGWLALTFERRNQLLTHLALRRGAIARTELAAMLWPQAPIEQAHTNLRKTLFRIHSLPWASAVVAQEHMLAFNGTTDVAAFEWAVAERRWTEALEIADAPLLAGFDDDASEPWSAWLRSERERLRQAWLTAARQCLGAATDTGDVLALSARLLADDPLDEAALATQMRAYIQQGQPMRAREAYRLYAARLADELRAAPSAELRALHDALGAPAASKPARQPAPTSPVRADGEQRIVGRVAERRDIHDRYAGGCRLLSLVGPGGVGKSSLARALLSELAPHHVDGAVYVPLEDVPSHDAMATRLARQLGLPRSGGADPLQAAVEYLRGRHMLLVFDNFEHLQGAAPQLQQLLQACPRVRMLVTSRARLGLPAEQLLPLDGLPCPEADDADCLEAFDAVQLFVRAAQAVEPALQTTAEADAIIDICRMVDGLPLALEIAAGWTRVRPCQAIASELRLGIELLTESDTARPARHASMAAVFDQSWRRLSPPERTALARLTVFHGGFTHDAARAVAGATLPVLATLTDQSLVRKSGSRADLHPLLRQLAAQHLVGDEQHATRAAHAAHCLQWLAPLLHGLKSGRNDVLQQVTVEFENVRAAWRWACVHGPLDALRSAVLPLLNFYDLYASRLEGLALLHEAATGAGADDVLLRPLLEAASAHLEYRVERYADAQARAARALQATRTTRDHETRLQCYKTLGACAMELGRLQRARRRFRQALAQAPAAIDPRSAAAVLSNIAVVEKSLGRYDVARQLYTETLVEHRRLCDAAGQAMCLSNMASLEIDNGDIEAAAVYVEEGLVLCERHTLTSTKMSVLANLTYIAVHRNDADAAQRYGQRAFEIAGQMGARGLHAWLRLQFAQLSLQQRNMPAARDYLRAAVEDTLAIARAPLQLDCVLSFASLVYAQGEASVATRLLRYAVDHPAITAPDRGRGTRWLTEWSPMQPAAATPGAPAMDLMTLLHRIVAETPSAHAALIESLRVL